MWGTLPTIEPTVMTSSVDVSVTISSSESQNVRQRSRGSTPASSSRSCSGAVSAARTSLEGHEMIRPPSSSNATCGRFSWKSKNSSGSIDAIGVA